MLIGRRALLQSLIAAGTGAVAGGGAYGYVYGRHQLETTAADVQVSGLPSALEGLRIGLLTCIHRSQWVPEADVRHAVQRLTLAKPDLIVLGGDYVTWRDRRFVAPSAEALEGLSAPEGLFAILGNHDDDHDM